MDSQAKRTLLATGLCLIILVGWLKLQQTVYPPPERPPGTPAPADVGSLPTTQPAGLAQAPTTAAAPSPGGPGPHDAQLVAPEYLVSDAPPEDPITLGDDHQREDNPWEFAVVTTQRGAAVETISLGHYRAHIAKDKNNPDHDPYILLHPVEHPLSGRRSFSFATERIRFKPDAETAWQTVHLADVRWSGRASSNDQAEAVTYQTVIRKGQTDLLALEKTYRLAPNSHHLEISLTVRNLTDQPYNVSLSQFGPLGIRREDLRFDYYRRIVAALVDDQGVSLGTTMARKDVFDKTDDESRRLRPGEDQHTLWTSLGNKYFACIVTPLPLRQVPQGAGPGHADYLAAVTGRVLLDDEKAKSDLTFVLELQPQGPVQPGQAITMTAEAYCGPKSDNLFDALPDDAQMRDYRIIRSADARWCAFSWLTTVMLWLLNGIHGLVGNYGIAIFFLVVIVRLALHPVTKRGQMNMMKMQKSMGQLRPKLEIIQQQYKNDKRKLQEEQMKLYREEGVNPAGSILGCLPMFLQMPVWVALWSALNTNVDMRHQPFFGWINDLSAPDALIPFPESWHFTIPLLGMMMGGPIIALNLLPIIMSVTMYAQQKLTQKLTKPTTPVKPKTDKDGNPLPDQMAQQQKIMSFMMIFFGLLFYNFPSGLSLYILTSNVLGMLEQWRIKTHIRQQDERGELDAAKKASRDKPSLFSRYIGVMQKKAEQARLAQSARPTDRPSKKKRRKRA